MLLRVPQVITQLLVHPAFRRGVKSDGQAHRHFGGNARAAIQNAGERLAAVPQRLRGVGDAHTEGIEAEFLEDLAGMGGLCMGMVSPL